MESAKLDLQKIDREYYNATRDPSIEIFGVKRYIAVDGSGKPGGDEYQNMIQTLFTLAYQIKDEVKTKGRDFVVSKLECLWWTDEGKSFDAVAPENWKWKLMIRIPDIVVHGDIEKAKTKVLNEKAMAEVSDIKLFRMNEGKCVQTMHVGSYETIGDSYDRITKFLKEKGLKKHGRFHEIYISGPDKTSAEKLKTIVRMPAVKI